MYLKGYCSKAAACTFRHVKSEKTKVCRFWIRGLCRKGEQCIFLHQFDLSKMPECQFLATYGECNNEDCIYLHLASEDKMKECEAYTRGFCPKGATCLFATFFLKVPWLNAAPHYFTTSFCLKLFLGLYK
jgi:cleavage and polyadenylation specificity factor subunit 4